MKKKLYTREDVEKIIALGRQKGFVTYDQVNDLLPDGGIVVGGHRPHLRYSRR